MGTQSSASNESKTDSKIFYNPRIPGLEALLKQTSVDPSEDFKGFVYYPTNGLNIVAYGAAGLGKTNLALQMAYAAATETTNKPTKRQVIFFSKDTESQVLKERIENIFNYFRTEKEYDPNDPRSSIPVFVLDEHLAKCLYEVLSYIERKEKSQNCHVRSTSHEIDPIPADVIGEFRGNGKLVQELGLSIEEKDDSDALADKVEIFLNSPYFCFVDFDEVPTNLNKVDRYALTHSVYDCLGDLEPCLRPLFRKLKKLKEGKETLNKACPQLFIVCDSLSAATLEEHLRVQARYEHGRDGSETKPIYLFIMENESMPKGMSVSFPPDVEIRLGLRQEQHDIQTHTIQLVKTRFQPSLDEVAPFVIRSATDKGTENQLPWIFELAHGIESNPQMDFSKISETPQDNNVSLTKFKKVYEVRPGIEIFPPLAHEEENIVPIQQGHKIKFCVEKLDQCTDQNELDGGGCTLLVTNNRCGATPLALHYLLGQVGQRSKEDLEKIEIRNQINNLESNGTSDTSQNTGDNVSRPENTLKEEEAELEKTSRPKSVLYINFSQPSHRI